MAKKANWTPSTGAGILRWNMATLWTFRFIFQFIGLEVEFSFMNVLPTSNEF